MAATGGTGRAEGPADPYARQAAAARAGLVRVISAAGGLRDPAWRAAFQEVPRHLFVPYYYATAAEAGPCRAGCGTGEAAETEGAGAAGSTGDGGGAAGAAPPDPGPGSGFTRLWQGDPDPERRWRWLAGAYADAPLATRLRDGELVSSSSQPSLMAQMLDALDVRGGERVLEIGAGTGYNAALLCHRLGDDRVTTVDLDPDITEAARRHLAAAGYRPAVVTGDGARGVPARAPYDRILATCALRTVPPVWLAQCAPAALILTPLATGLVRLRVAPPDAAEGRFLDTPAYFVPLRGGPEAPDLETAGVPRRALRVESFRFLLTLTAGRLDPEAAYAVWEAAGRPGRERYGVTVRGGRQWAWLDEPEGEHTWEL